MNFDRVLSKNEELISGPLGKALEGLNLSLYDFDYQPGTSTYRVFIYSEVTKTASLEDCIAVDRQLSLFFDECSDLPDNVTLEVSSPGVYRFLKKRFHFEMSINEAVKIKLNNTVEGIKGKIIEGSLEKVDDQSLTILDSRNNNKYTINFNNIKSAQADYKF